MASRTPPGQEKKPSSVRRSAGGRVALKRGLPSEPPEALAESPRPTDGGAGESPRPAREEAAGGHGRDGDNPETPSPPLPFATPPRCATKGGRERPGGSPLAAASPATSAGGRQLAGSASAAKPPTPASGSASHAPSPPKHPSPKPANASPKRATPKGKAGAAASPKVAAGSTAASPGQAKAGPMAKSPKGGSGGGKKFGKGSGGGKKKAGQPTPAESW